MFNKMLRGALVAVSLTLGACTIAPMVDPPTVEVPAGLPQSEVERIILYTAVQNEWTVVEHKPGRILLRYAPREFWVNTAVTYDNQQIAISYVDSNELDYDPNNGHPMIHRNYNRWVLNLAHDIKAQLLAQSIH